jgi:hypothetical protein
MMGRKGYDDFSKVLDPAEENVGKCQSMKDVSDWRTHNRLGRGAFKDALLRKERTKPDDDMGESVDGLSDLDQWTRRLGYR